MPAATWILSLCQAFYFCVSSIGMTLSGLVGQQLAPSVELATLPFALITVATAATTIPFSLLMGRVGRRPVFMLGAIGGGVGGLVSAWAIYEQSFLGFCLGSAGLGIFQATAGYYSFAAADVTDPARKSKAISRVMAGGVIAAAIGPLLGAWARDLLAPILFAGSYLVLAGLAFTSAAVMTTLVLPPPARAAAAAGRPLGEILRQPVFVAGLANNLIGFVAMIFVMTATPLAAVACSHSVGDAAAIIQLHLIGMFAPSFVTGHLIARFGVVTVVLTGMALFLVSVAAALDGITLPHFMVALALNGIAWNFMSVGGTSLIARSYSPGEQAKTQAAAQFTTFGLMAIGSMSAGGVLARFGWETVNLVVLPLLAVALAATLWFWASGRQGPAAAAA